MKKAEKIKQVADDSKYQRSYAVRALFIALTDDEIHDIYFKHISDKFFRINCKRQIIRRVVESRGNMHMRFFRRLFNMYKKAAGRMRMSYGAFIKELAPRMSAKLLTEIIRYCADSGLWSDRSRAYALCNHVWNDSIEKALVSCCEKYEEFECFKVLMSKANINLVSPHFEDLWYNGNGNGNEEDGPYEREKYRFLKRLAKERVRVFDKLEHTHPASFLYAMAVGRFEMTDERASRLFDKAARKGNGRFAAWSIATMHKWDLLLEKIANYDKWLQF